MIEVSERIHNLWPNFAADTHKYSISRRYLDGSYDSIRFRRYLDGPSYEKTQSYYKLPVQKVKDLMNAQGDNFFLIRCEVVKSHGQLVEEH